MGSEAGGQARQGDSPQSQKTPETDPLDLLDFVVFVASNSNDNGNGNGK